MKMVLEEIEGELARFIPDEGPLVHVKKDRLPENYRLGELYEVTIEDERIISIKPLKKETEERFAKMKQKRAKLLNKKR
ncbi:hypothetical protein [Carnobacterium sp.]|uniref:hypothetical protein n=1 Tax=Carnobacterium sp. TaxID=48221 RepID=UPI0038907ACA